MNNTNTGGPAFPCETVGRDEHGEYRLPWEGMTLRDYFAAKAMAAHITCWLPTLARTYANDTDAITPIITAAAYEMADAMLKERNKP